MHKIVKTIEYIYEILVAKISVKEFENNSSGRIYSIEAIDIEKPALHLDSRQSDNNLNVNPTQAFSDIKIRQLVEEAKAGLFSYTRSTEVYTWNGIVEIISFIVQQFLLGEHIPFCAFSA